MDYTIAELEKWSERIEEIAREEGLDFYPQEFEIVDYEEMLAYEAYVGMPSRYPHWSFGKAYERLKTLYQYNLTGLPYELVINSNPCLAYLLKENTLLLQILTMAHVYAHNDFFKNNRLFQQGTEAQYTLEKFKNHGKMIREYVNDPSIGYERVEKILNAAHSIKLQINRTVGLKEMTDEEKRKKLLEDYKSKTVDYNILDPPQEIPPPDLTKEPVEPQEDLLFFLIQYAPLEDWERSILEIVWDESKYFLPQIETKIINEGWASFWHYKILHKLNLPPSLHLEFIKRHNDVVRPVWGNINPYFLGFHLFQDLAERYGTEKIFEVRSMERDQSFLRRYLTQELCEKLHLFEYVKGDHDYIITEIADEEGWKKIRDTLCNNCGMAAVPLIKAVDISKSDRTLTLEHVFDGRELYLDYAEETLKYIGTIWGQRVLLKTRLNNRDVTIVCDENLNIKYW